MNSIGHGFGMGFVGWFIPILVIGLLYYLFQDKRNTNSNNTSAQDILDKRYANGEIDKKEYDERSQHIKDIRS